MKFVFQVLVLAIAVLSIEGQNDYDRDGPPRPYAYQYAVNDADSGVNINAEENSDGNVVKGSYRVLLPDGRVQVVTYTANENGYVADVQYEGKAAYPKFEPYNKPLPL